MKNQILTFLFRDSSRLIAFDSIAKRRRGAKVAKPDGRHWNSGTSYLPTENVVQVTLEP